MDEPDLQLCGLSIWVNGHEFPDAPHYWDRNWLKVRATMEAGQASVTTEGPILMTRDFERFRFQLATMNDELTGEAVLSGYEPNLKVTLSAGRLGHITGKVEITPDHLSQFHRFDVRFDQTYLSALVGSLDVVLDRYPVVDWPES